MTLAAFTSIIIFDIDGVVRDVGNSYRRALADTVEQFTGGAYRPSQADIDVLKAEGRWNNDWEASQEMVYRHFEQQGQARSQLNLNYQEMVAFFQSRYRGVDPDNPDHWTGYICQEPLLMQSTYLEHLTQSGLPWGFFSGATRGSATYVLERRLGLQTPVLIAMEDAPRKPDPTGLLAAVKLVEARYGITEPLPVVYAGDTVADMQTIEQARQIAPTRRWLGAGILPPHAQSSSDYAAAYVEKLQQSGAAVVLNHVEQLTATAVQQVLQQV